MFSRVGRPSWENAEGRIAATYGGVRAGNMFVVPVIAKTDFSFDGRSGSGNMDTVLAQGIDASAWVSGILAVRVFAKNTWGSASARLDIIVQNVQIEPDQPDIVFVSPSSTLVADQPFADSGVTVPSLNVLQLVGPIGPQLRVVARWNQGANAGTGAQTMTLAVDLFGRPA